MDLPLEIWRQITSFLDVETVKGLYTVNHALFNLAMDAKYRDIKFDQVNGILVHRLNTLRNPKYAERVQRVHLSPHIFRSDQVDDGQVSYEETSPKGTKSRFRKLSRLFFGTPLSPKQQHDDNLLVDINQADDDALNVVQLVNLPRDLEDVIPLMKNVHSFGLSWLSPRDFPVRYLDISWKTFSPNLVELDLTVTTAKAVAMFPLPVKFPLLESLKLHILGRTSIAAAQDSLSSFVNSLHSSLKKLCVRSTPVRNLSDFYLSLGYFNTLTLIDVDISTDNSFKSGTPPGYATFLDQQNKVVEELVLFTPPEHSNSLWRLGLEEVRLHKLERLSISAPLIDNSWDHSLRITKMHIRTLTEFKTEGQIYPGHLVALLETFHHKNPYSLLTRLSFYAVHLDAKLMDHLADALSRLEYLTLTIGCVSTNGKSSIIPTAVYPQGPNGEHAFTRGMRSFESLRKWKLTDITIKRRSCCGDLYLWGLMLACARFIPSVTSFVGNGDMEVPVPSNRAPKHTSSTPCRYGIDHTK